MDIREFAERVRPLAELLAGVELDDAAAAKAAIDEAAPLDGALVAEIRELAFEGEREGWLLPKENGGVRFGRVAKDLAGFSVDAVWMNGPGPRHRHPKGEIDLLFVSDGQPTFDGRQPGWTVYPPDSVHVPSVSDGEMLILYFLPAGEIEWL